MSTGIWARLDGLFHQGMHHPNIAKRREIAMSAYTHLKACVDAGNAKIAEQASEINDLKSQLATARRPRRPALRTPTSRRSPVRSKLRSGLRLGSRSRADFGG